MSWTSYKNKSYSLYNYWYNMFPLSIFDVYICVQILSFLLLPYSHINYVILLLSLLVEAVFKFVLFRHPLKKLSVYKVKVNLIYLSCFFEFILIGVVKLARMDLLPDEGLKGGVIGFEYNKLELSIYRFAIVSFLSLYINAKTFQKKYLQNKKLKKIKQRLVTINKSYFKNEVKITSLVKAYVHKELLLEDINSTVKVGRPPPNASHAVEEELRRRRHQQEAHRGRARQEQKSLRDAEAVLHEQLLRRLRRLQVQVGARQDHRHVGLAPGQARRQVGP